MKLLVDNQLPLALARFLAANDFDCQHVQDIGMGATDDRAIWEYAKSHDMAIVTKDEDFPLMADRQGSIPPQVVWVRLGNCRKAALLQAFATLLPDLRRLLDDGGSVIEIR
jgi:predicted nuclease of predicted toxin-antitoxin system